MVHGGFGGVIGGIRHPGVADRRDRRDVDDRPAALTFHDRDDVLHSEKAALEIDREHPIPGLLRELDHATDLGNPHIVIKYVDALVALKTSRHHGSHLVCLRSIGLESFGRASFAADNINSLRAAAALMSTQNTRAPSRANSTAVA